MEIYLDSADPDEIKAGLARGIRGVTTNPSLVARAGHGEYGPESIIEMMCEHDPEMHLSVEPATNVPGMFSKYAERLHTRAEHHPGLAIKVPIEWNNLAEIAEIRGYGFKVNVTACMTVNQALIAANAGADYVSIFWGRIQDIGQPSLAVVSAARQIFERGNLRTKIIVGSIRAPIDVAEAFISGAHIVTVPYPILEKMCKHPQTDVIVGQFLADAGVEPPNR